MKFGGQLDFISTLDTGSTFIFTFDFEVNCDEEMIENQARELNEMEPQPIIISSPAF